jgi:MYXO-CTERM domain-containing protein
MTRKGVLAAGAATGMFLAGTASAAFVGFTSDSYSVNVNGTDYAVIDVFANFDNNVGTVLNVFNANISTTDGSAFHHQDFNTLGGQPGAWNITGSGNIPGLVNPAIDSFVMIGGPVGGTNTTSLDPNFSPGTGPTIAPLAGWFNSNPPNLQGRVDPATLRTQIGRFVVVGITTSRSLSFAAEMSWNEGLGTQGGNGQGSFSAAFVPAPGAVALLALGGLVGGRRRRN